MPWTTSRVSLPTMIATLRVQATLRGHSSAFSFARSDPRLEDRALEAELAAFDAVGDQLADPGPILVRRARPIEPRLEVDPLVLELVRLELEPGLAEHAAPLVLGVVPNMGRVAQLVGLLARLAHEQVVRDEHERAADAGHLLQRPCRILEMVRRDPARHDVEA